MMLSRIRLSNFRNHDATAVDLAGGVNAFLGDNGQGKTSILEAASYLSLTKSFYAAGDAEVIAAGREGFDLDGELASDAGFVHRVAVACRRAGPEKKFLIDGSQPETLASAIGMFPLVVLSPENGAITFGGPGERRKFLDLTLSQVSQAYLGDILEYRRALRQRNRVLADARLRGSCPPHLLEPWTESVAAAGGSVAMRRAAFVGEFRSYVERAYRSVIPDGELPAVSYVCGFDPGDAADARGYGERLAAELSARAEEERRRGLTLAGPHRDDLRLTVNGMDVQRFASQGQHRTLLVALKLAEFAYMRERRQETPMLLLDDVFSELDRGRVRRILGLAAELGQVMITTTDGSVFDGAVGWGDRHRRFTVEHGTCRQEA
ncbi:MAG TPA: DNA replication/repair protein RecF [Bacteroidota bacterium]|nr:DNA replication/repair protein RecF [Bacteroidota bacterium]